MAEKPVFKLPKPLKTYAINEDPNTVNRIHSDDVATTYGFKGALVAGAYLFGHTSELLTQAYGDKWLSRGELVARFLKPAYDGDLLKIEFSSRRSRDKMRRVECKNEAGDLLSTLDFQFLPQLPEPSHLSRTLAPQRKMVRREIRWSSVRPGEAFPEITWAPSDEENITCAGAHAKNLSLWESGLVHPRLWIDLANRALTNRFIMPAWLHIETKIIARSSLRTGTTYRLVATPELKWRRRGSEYLRLYVAILDEDGPRMEIWHTANFLIFRA